MRIGGLVSGSGFGVNFSDFAHLWCQQLNLCHATLPSDYIYYAIVFAHKIMMANNFLFLPKSLSLESLPFIRLKSHFY